MAIGCICILLCLLFNPFLALFFLAVLSGFARVPTTAFFVSVPLSFALFFFFREYGVDWSAVASDDIPGYVWLYEQNYLISFFGIFSRFFEIPGSNEPLWQIPWWLLLHAFDASEKAFIFIHYVVVFLAIFVSFFVLSKRYFIVFSLLYFFITPLSIDSATYLWRQQLAFSLFLIGVGFYMVKGKPFGKWLIYLTPLMHLSLIFFVVIFLAFELYKKYVGLNGASKFLLIAILNLSATVIVAPLAIAFLDAIGFSRLESYLEGSAADQAGVFLSILVYCAVLLLAHLKLRTDDLNTFFAVVLLATFGVALGFPSANAVYVRLLMFVFPLYGIYFFRCYLMNFSKRWFLVVIILAFASGTIRIYRTTLNEEGVVRFLAYGHPFDPIMGVAKMLSSF